MSYSQSYNNEGSSSGGGCFTLLLLAAAAFAVFMALGGGDSSTTTTDTRSGLLSGNQTEVLSRNQLNLFSDVWNCFGDNSCIITTETNTSTANNSTNVDGDRNAVSIAPTVFPDGVLRCYDQTAQAWTVEECSRQGVQP